MPSHFKSKTSVDANTWKTQYSTESGGQGVVTISLNGGATAQFVRMEGISRATKFGYSLWELQIF